MKTKASEKESAFSGDTANAAGSKSIMTGDISLDKITDDDKAVTNVQKSDPVLLV